MPWPIPPAKSPRMIGTDQNPRETEHAEHVAEEIAESCARLGVGLIVGLRRVDRALSRRLSDVEVRALIGCRRLRVGCRGVGSRDLLIERRQGVLRLLGGEVVGERRRRCLGVEARRAEIGGGLVGANGRRAEARQRADPRVDARVEGVRSCRKQVGRVVDRSGVQRVEILRPCRLEVGEVRRRAVVQRIAVVIDACALEAVQIAVDGALLVRARKLPTPVF